MADDRVALWWAARDGTRELTVDLDVAAELQRAERPVVLGRGRVRRVPSWQIAAKLALGRDRLAEVERERAELIERIDRDWLRRVGIDPSARR